VSGRSIAVLTVVNGAGAVVGIVMSAVTAHLFGTGRALEVYFAASTVLSLITSLTQVGQIAEIYLPNYHRLRHQRGLRDAQLSFSVVVNWMLIGVTVLGALLWLAAPYVVYLLVPGFSHGDQLMGVTMFRWLLPLVLYEVIVGLLQTLSNAEHWFGRPEAANVVGSTVTLGALVLFVRMSGIWAMVISLWIGRTTQLLIYLAIAFRMGYRHRLVLRQDGFSVRALFAQLLFTLGYVGATQLYAFALNAGLSLLPQGMYAVFNYVQQLYAKTQTVLLRPVTVVFFTHVSSALAKGVENVRELAQTALARSLMIWSVIMAAIVVAGRPTLSGLWGASRFGADNLTIALRLLIVFYLLLFVTNVGQIARKTAMSIGAVRRVYLYCSGMQVLSAGAAFLLLPRFGIAGAAAVVVVNVCGLTAAQLMAVGYERPALVTGYPVSMLWKWSAAMVAAIAVGRLVASQTYYASTGRGRLGEVIWAIALAGLAASVALLVAWLLRVPDVRAGTRLLWHFSNAD